MRVMNDPTASAIARLVEYHQGPSKVSQLLGGKPVYQEVQRWVARGWASPMHILALEPFLPDGMTIHDLNADRFKARGEVAPPPGPPPTFARRTTDHPEGATPAPHQPGEERRHEPDRRADARLAAEQSTEALAAAITANAPALAHALAPAVSEALAPAIVADAPALAAALKPGLAAKKKTDG